jgi:glutamyl-tRNA synthetase
VKATGGSPRVRFAPSPTGYFHVGGARTALYNWLFARRLGGTFVLRIEDTDRERSDDAWISGILSALEWLGISWDEGPYRQSERLPLYEKAAAELFAAGRLYACDCSRADVEARNPGRTTPGYDGYCRDRALTPGPGRALRFRTPDEGVTLVHDVVRGDVEFPNSTIEDFVVVKSSGDPLFVLAVVVDDISMGITHVIRAEEHLPTTPKAVMLWEALGAGPVPVFAHLPVLVNDKRQKLSKRRDRVSVEDYRAMGILPEAMRNYLALLGWSPADGREVLDLEELVSEFRLEDVNNSPAFFDERRLLHFNGLYIRALDEEEFLRRALPFLEPPSGPWAPGRFDRAQFERLAPLVKERVATLGEVAGMVDFLFADPFVVDDHDRATSIGRDPGARALLEQVAEGFRSCGWDAGSIRAVVTAAAEASGRKLAKAQAPVRVATMGRAVGLPLFESLEVLGRERALGRVLSALGAGAGTPAGTGPGGAAQPAGGAG